MPNKQNYRHWGPENPHWVIEQDNQRRWKLNVWLGIFGDRLIGPYFFEGNLNGRKYWRFLNNDLPRLFGEDLGRNRGIWWMQDGAPAHNTFAVRETLHRMFGIQWMGYRGPVSYPPRTPILNPLDMFAWGYIKVNI